MYSRRTVLKSVAVAGAAAAYAGSLKGLRAVAQTGLPLRRSLGELALDDPIIETYREFVGKMKELPSSDRFSWIGFANVHGESPFAFHLCPHGNWYFVPWHRAYVQMYEVACRKLTGNQDFAMPYWDWTADRLFPKAFSDERWQGRPNPLFEASRTIPPNYPLPDNMVGETEVMEPILRESHFEIFGTSRPAGQNSLAQRWITTGTGTKGPLEYNPHDRIHGTVGGVMGGTRSPRDPIFMMHHGNIDRIWAVWNGRGHSNTTDRLWLDMEFQNNFIAPDGSLYSKTVRDLQEVEPLGYTYGLRKIDELAPVDPLRDSKIAALYGAAPLLGDGPLRVRKANDTAAEAGKHLEVKLRVDSASLADAVKPRISAGTGALALAADPSAARTPEVLAYIKNMTPPKKSGTEFRVFVNCDYLSQEVPTTDPHYAGTVGFFGHHAVSVVVNLTETLKRHERTKHLTGDDITVQLLPVPQPGVPLEETGTITPTEIEIAII